MIRAIKDWTIGIVGAGQMGAGIAQTCAMSGLKVRLYDLDQSKIDAALDVIRRRLERTSPRLTEVELIRGSSQIADLSCANLVIEAATENETIKRKVLLQISNVIGPDTLMATNTSSLSITRLAAATDRPEKFMGIHFMNPVPVMKLVELVRGIETSQETFAAAAEFVGALGKQMTVSEDFPGFIVNRILLPMINEAIYTLHEGVGRVDAIDTAMKLGANHPMGPLQLADFIGLDICLSIMQVLHDSLADSKYRPCPLLVKYVEAGWLGRKVGRGFYDYRGGTPVATR